MVFGNIVAVDRQCSHLHPHPSAADELEPLRLDPSGAAAAADHGVNRVFFGVIARLDRETIWFGNQFLMHLFCQTHVSQRAPLRADHWHCKVGLLQRVRVEAHLRKKTKELITCFSYMYTVAERVLISVFILYLFWGSNGNDDEEGKAE